MAHTKSQLPMIRSLKVIARRKKSEDIKVTQEQRDEFARNEHAYSETIAKLKALYVKRAPVSLLRAIALRAVAPATLNEEQRKALLAYDNDMIGIVRRTRQSIGPTDSYVWVTQEKNRRQALFTELENIELQIIAGEYVDLAPYAQQLKS